MRKWVTTEVEVDIELDDFDDKELIEELRERGFLVYADAPTVMELYEALHLKRADADNMVRKFVESATGRLI